MKLLTLYFTIALNLFQADAFAINGYSSKVPSELNQVCMMSSALFATKGDTASELQRTTPSSTSSSKATRRFLGLFPKRVDTVSTMNSALFATKADPASVTQGTTQKSSRRFFGLFPKRDNAIVSKSPLTDEEIDAVSKDSSLSSVKNVYASPITVAEIDAAQKAWGDALIKISDTYNSNGYYAAKKLAQEVLDSAYGYNIGGAVSFKPTLAFGDQAFRFTNEGALSYFVGQNSKV